MIRKSKTKKKRRRHGKSIIQPKEDKRCYLCMLLNGDCREKQVEEHHMIHGTANRQKSEELGLKCNLCQEHHKYGPEAVHDGSPENDLLLKRIAQKAYERTHTREEWMSHIGKNFLEEDKHED